MALPNKRIKQIQLPSNSETPNIYDIVPERLQVINQGTAYEIAPPSVSENSTLVVTSDLATVATTGSYTDLINKPTYIENAGNADKVDQLHMLDQSFAYKETLSINIGTVQAIVHNGLTEAEILALAPTDSIAGQLYYASDTHKFWRRNTSNTGASASYWRDDTANAQASLALANQLSTEEYFYVRINTDEPQYTKLTKFFVEANWDNIRGTSNILGFCRQQNHFEITSCFYNGNNLVGIYQESANTNKYIFKFRTYDGRFIADNTYMVTPTIYINFSGSNPAIELISEGHTDYSTVSNYSYVKVPSYGIAGTAIYGSLKPLTNNSYDLGDSSHKWRDLHLSRNLYLYGKQIKDSSYTWTLPNKTGTIALTSDAPLYWCTYNTTTYAEITQALSDGKLPVVKVDGKICVYTHSPSSFHCFTYTYLNYNFYARVNSSNTWNTGGTYTQNITERKTSISDTSTDSEYPTSLAVYNFVNNSLPTNVSELTNDAGYITNATAQITESQVTNLTTDLQEIREIAEGRKQTFVVDLTDNPSFNTQNDKIYVHNQIVDTQLGVVPATDINVGDSIYITDSEIPDRWVSGKSVDSSQITTLANTHWVFHETIDCSSNFYYYADYTIPNIENHGTAMRVWRNNERGYLYFYGILSDTVAYNTGDTLTLPAQYRDITFGTTGTDIANPAYIAYMQANADLQAGGDLILECSKLETAKVPITSISVNNSTITPVNGNVDITVPTKTSDVTNDSGFITLSDVPQELYWCTYGTTTYAQITTALNAGKLPICFYDGKEYTYVGLSTTNRYTFGSQLFDTYHYISVNNSNSWGNGTNNFEVVSNKVTSISSSSTDSQYPSAKAVNTFVTNSLPTIGTLNTTNSTALTPSASESFSSTINLHKVAKTGTAADLVDFDTLVNTSTDQTISGVKTFTSRPTLTVKRLPNAYQEVQYIQTTGTQYFDTGVVPQNYLKGEIYGCWTQVDNTAGHLLSARSGSTGYNTVLGWNSNSGLFTQFSSSTFSKIVVSKWTQPVIISGFVESTSTTTTLGENSASLSSTPTYYNLSLYINARHIESGATDISSYKYYYVKIYINNNLVKHYIPCYRKSDNTIGFYELVNETFLPASGTGTCIIGNTVVDSNFLVYSDLAEVAISGDYTDLANKPTHTLDQSASNKVRLTVTGEAAQEITINNVANASNATFAEDSDKLDGHSSSYFAVDAEVAKLAGAQTITGQKNFTLDPTIDWELNTSGQAVDISDFTAIDYLIFNGTDYIDPGLIFTPNTQVSLDITMQDVGVGAQGLLGHFDAGAKRAYIVKNTAAANIQISDSTNSFTDSPGFNSNQRYLIEWKNKCIYVDNVLAVTATTILDFESSPSYLGNRYNEDLTVTNGLKGRFYGATWVEENGNNHVYKPCYQVSTNQVGFFDINFGYFYPVYNYSDTTTPKTYTLNTTGGPVSSTPLTFNSTIADYVTNAVNTVASKVRIPSWTETTAIDNISSGPIHIGGTVSSSSNNNTYINFGTAADPKTKNAFITTYNNGFIMGASGQTLYFMMDDAFRPTSNANGAALKLGNTTRAWNSLYLSTNGQSTTDAGAIIFNESYAGTLKPAILTAARNWTLPDLSGTISLTDAAQTISATKTYSTAPVLANGIYLKGARSNGTAVDLIGVTSGNNMLLGTASVTNIVSYNTIRPNSSNSLDLGTSSQLWKDAYIAGELKDGTNSVSVANIMTTNTAQVVTETKTFDNTKGIDSKDSGGTARHLLWVSNSNNVVLGDSGYTGDITVYQNIRPVASKAGQIDLGTASYQWQNIYLTNGSKLINATKNTSYGLTLPDTTGWSANKTIATTDQIPSVSLTTTTGSEAITVASDSLNVVTRDTAQIVTGEKTFVGEVQMKSSVPSASAANNVNGFRFKSSTGTLLAHMGTNDTGGLGFYANTLYYRPAMAADGSVDTTKGITMDTTGMYPGSTSMPLGKSSNPWGEIFTNKLTITNTSMANHIEFKRNGWSYIAATGGANSVFGFVAGGQSSSGATTTLAIADTKIFPGFTSNTIDIGGTPVGDGGSNYTGNFKDLYLSGKINTRYLDGSTWKTYERILQSKSGTIAYLDDIPDTSNDVTTTDTLTSDYVIIGNGNKTVKKSSLLVSDIALKSEIPEAMIFKGSVGDAGDSPTITWANLPSAGSTNKGHTYKVITAHATAPICKVGDTIISNGIEWVIIPSGDEPGGTVTSVGMTVPTGLSVSPAVITTSGTFDITYASGYSIPSNTKQNEWDAKYDKPSGGIPDSDLAGSYVTTNTEQTITATKTFGTSSSNADVKIAYGALVLDGVAESVSSTTSSILFNNGSTNYHSIKANTTGILFSAAGNNYGFYSTGFIPTASNDLDLGRSTGTYGRWRHIHVTEDATNDGTFKKYVGNNTYTIALPNASGTLALTSDINDATLNIQQNGVSVGTFTANATTSTTVNIVTPQVMRFI